MYVILGYVLNCIEHIREKPLAVYAFTSDKVAKEKIATRTSSGGLSFNDVMVHFAGKW